MVICAGFGVVPLALLGADSEDEPPPLKQVGKTPVRLPSTRERPPELSLGTAVTDRGGGGRRPSITIIAMLPVSGGGEAYEVWAYNSDKDAKSLGARPTDRQGNYRVSEALPRDFRRYHYVDISREKQNTNRRHSGVSVMRAELVMP